MVLVFGTICIDRLRRVEKLPQLGGYAEVIDEHVMLGGEAANTATALTFWKHDVRLTGNRLGDDDDGAILSKLVAEKELPYVELDIDVHAVPFNAAPVCDVYVTPDGERTMFGRGFKDAGHGLQLDRIPFESGAWFTAEPNMTELSETVARMAHERGMKIYLMDFLWPDEPIASGSFWQGSTDWAGHRNNTQKNVAWVKDLVAKHGCFSILSDGPNGFVAGSPTHPVRAYPPFPAPEVVDTTGAGDMFRAGMLHGLDSGWPIEECLKFAAAAGCLKCKGLGATTYVPSVEEIVTHIAENDHVARQYGP